MLGGVLAYLASAKIFSIQRGTERSISPTNEPRREKTSLRGFRPGLTAQTGLKVWNQDVEEFHCLYLYSENRGADQLRDYRTADLRLCFCICKNRVFSRRGSISRCEQQRSSTPTWFYINQAVQPQS